MTAPADAPARRLRVMQLLPDMQLGGVERGVVELSRALAADGHDSIVVSRAGALCQDVTAGGGRHIEFDCGGKNPFTAPARARRLRALLTETAPDIVHVRSRVPAWLLAFAGRGRAALASTFHGLYSVSRYSAQMARADAVICPSNAVREHILRHYSAHVSADKLHIIHRGVDFAYFDPAKIDAPLAAELQTRWRLAGHTVFTLAGRVSAIKGHDLFLRAFAEICRRPPPGKPPLALIVGDEPGRRRDQLQQLARQLGIAAQLRLGGAARQMREVYACSDVVVSASIRPEAFGRTVAEALAMGVPAVAPAHGGALDIISDGGNGVLFRPGDAAALVAALAAAAALPRARLRESVAAFSLERMAAQTLALYQRIAP